MQNWECAILEKLSTGPLLGFSYYPADFDNDFSEFNLYLIFFVIHFKFYNDEQNNWGINDGIGFGHYICFHNIPFKLKLWVKY